MTKMRAWVGFVACLLPLGMLAVSTAQTSLQRNEQLRREGDAAVAMLAIPAAKPGSNAFASVWLLRYEVPALAHEAVMSEDVAAFDRRLQLRHQQVPHGFEATDSAAFVSAARDRYPYTPSTKADLDALCGLTTDDCLDYVRAHREQAITGLSAFRPLLPRIAAIGQHGHIADRFSADAQAPAPEWGLLRARLSEHALDFVDGRVDAALSATCTDAVTWRRLSTNSYQLVATVVGRSFATASVTLASQMLAELPPDHPLPASCRLAFSPPLPEEALTCRAISGEFRTVAAAIVGPDHDPDDSGIAKAVLRRDDARRRLATLYAPACNAQTRRSVMLDRPVPRTDTSSYSLGCLLSLTDCQPTAEAGFDHSRSTRRGQDTIARLRMAAALLWLRDRPQDARPLPTRLAEMPASLRGPGRAIEPDVDGRGLKVALFEPGKDGPTHARLPLPASRHSAAGR
ncbi:hypothetical protein [Montanilutibacter psychrotolerans]|uniref:Uncharacterized protein n=1 Tax=Montanilutibacter psychrotolerans TaxID=1327343 RepID=A0A3M8SYA5_9GAMM|nr:hypothetical protein [Lysobacter psychrotolerans]RNF86337.1 hypothetical protein EER27_02650 [Lysobacter psychrotolerans]